MKYFTLAELTYSSTAASKKIDNTPTDEIKSHLVETVNNLLDPIRAFYGKPIKVTSCYRCKELNTAVGGASNSSHMTGYAADIKPVDGNMKEMQKKVLEWAKTHNFDQIILEQCTRGVASWLHVGWKRSNGTQRKQYLTAKKVNGKWTYAVYVNK